jgi:hypothetical protein
MQLFMVPTATLSLGATATWRRKVGLEMRREEKKEESRTDALATRTAVRGEEVEIGLTSCTPNAQIIRREKHCKIFIGANVNT